jgi:prepilin-type N-terminal cleavage/methylation domain-containing protein
MLRTKYKNINIVKNSGFTLIEAMLVIFIFALITVTFYRTYTIGTRHIIDSKNRLGAISAANEKMEIIRNLKYEDIGTVNGSVSGNIPDEESLTENASRYVVKTTVEFTDDPLDGVAYEDTNNAPEDYKKVTVGVFWNNESENIQLVSRFVPMGREVASPGDGILQINVFSDQPGGEVIANSAVHVENSDMGLDTVVQTDSTGSVTLMGDKIKNSIQKYKITLSKSGYETVSTMPPYPATAFNPVDVHASVVVGSMNVANIVQDKLAAFKVKTVDYLDNPIPNVGFHITGGRKIGTEALEPYGSIFNLDTDSDTDSNGEKNFGSISPGQYIFSLLSSVSDYVLIDTDPITPTTIFSDDDLTLKAKLADKNTTSLLVKVVSSVDGITPVVGAEVKLFNGSGYDATQTSSGTGTVFFPMSSDQLQTGDYSLKVTASGFEENNSQTTIESKLNTLTITLTSL